MTNEQLLQRVYIHVGSEEQTGLVEPMVLAMADLAYIDLARFLIDTDQELAKKLINQVTSQTWTNSTFSAPSDMLFHVQKPVLRLELGSDLCFQVQDRDKLNMIGTTLDNTYYALEGKTFYIKHKSGTSSGTNLNLRYYKVPTVSDIDDELTPLFLDLLFRRLAVAMQSSQPQGGGPAMLPQPPSPAPEDMNQ